MSTSTISGRQPARIAFLVHGFHIGGLERCIAHLVNRLDRSRFSPLLICLDRNGAASHWFERSDVDIVEMHKPPGNSLRIVGALGRTLQHHSVQLVHSHNWGTLLEASLACRRLPGVRHVHAAHGLELDAFRVSGWKRQLRKRAMGWAMRRADAVVAVADAVKEWVCDDCRVPPSHVQVIPNGVARPEFEPSAPEPDTARQALGIGAEAFVFGSVGRLVALKDFGACIAALAQLARNGRDAHFVLIGDGPEKEALSAAASDLGMSERVHFAGQQTKIGGWLRLLDVYVNSSRTEAMNMGILEAMAMGLPVVATDVGDAASMILRASGQGAGGLGAGSAGRLTPAGSPELLAEALADFADDSELRRSTSAAAAAAYEAKYTVDRFVTAYTELYESLLFPRHEACAR